MGNGEPGMLREILPRLCKQWRFSPGPSKVVKSGHYAQSKPICTGCKSLLACGRFFSRKKIRSFLPVDFSIAFFLSSLFSLLLFLSL
jgi:hypothetical protein